MTRALPNQRYVDAALIARYELAGHRCGQLLIALGLAVMLGWATGSVTLTRLLAEWAAMQPNTALCLILVGTALLSAGHCRTDRRWRALRLACALSVGAIGLATLIACALGLPLAIGQPFSSGRMATATATNFLLTGTALALLDSRARALSAPLALAVMCSAVLALLGYAYGVSALYDIGFFSTVALHTAIGTLLAASGIVLVRPDQGCMAMLVSSTVGGVLARRLLPLAIATPFLLGWLHIEGERRAFYDSGFGVALTALCYVVLFGLFIWSTTDTMRRSDDLRLDVEQIKQAHQAQMNGLIESALDAIVMLDDAQRIIVFNPAAENMFGCARADLLGTSFNQLLPQRFRGIHDGHLRAFGSAGLASRRMGRPGAVTAVRANGVEFPAEVSISHFNLGHGICYTAIVRDITERVRIEGELLASERRERERSQELSNLLFAVPAAVCIAHDRLLAAVTGNALYEHWFAGAAAGKGGDLHAGHAALRRAAGGVEMRDHEFRHVDAEGNTRYLLGNVMPLRDEHGEPCGAISAFVDVTELKLSERAMVSVTAGSVAKSDYITHMTHELRTPLGTMLGYAQLLETANPPPLATQLRALRQILKAGWYLRDLITEVQDLATIEADAAGSLCGPVGVAALLQDVLAMIAPALVQADLRITVADAGAVHILANPVRIKQVMLNLLSNAIKYNRHGGSIAVSCSADVHAQVRIGVRDTGHGLTPKELASLFQPFNRLGQQHGKEVGTGVGLVVTKKLVESMGGCIGAESEAGCGCLFWFSMPAVEAKAALL